MTWKPKRLTRQQMEERRLAGGRLLRKHRLTRTQIARRLGVSRAAVSQWAKRLRSGGLRRLRARKSTGRPSKLTPQQQCVLLRKLKRGARAAGFPTELWDRSPTHTSKKVTAYLAERSDIDVEWLPPFAPEINPEEYCHGNIKQNMKYATPADKHEIRATVGRGFSFAPPP